MSPPTIQPPPPRTAPATDEAGLPKHFAQVWHGWFRSVYNYLNSGFTGTRTINGETWTYQNGKLISIQ